MARRIEVVHWSPHSSSREPEKKAEKPDIRRLKRGARKKDIVIGFSGVEKTKQADVDFATELLNELEPFLQDEEYKKRAQTLKSALYYFILGLDQAEIALEDIEDEISSWHRG